MRQSITGGNIYRIRLADEAQHNETVEILHMASQLPLSSQWEEHLTMTRLRFSLCALLVAGISGTANAQILGRGGVTGGATAGVAGGVTSGVVGSAAGTSAGAVTQSATATNARALGQTTDTAATMRQNTALSSSVQPLLPADTDMTRAAAGFEDTNQFMTAVHASRNMGIPFDQMKAKTTGKGHVSIEKAAKKLRPDLDDQTIKENLKLAEKQSDRDLARASSSERDHVSARMSSNSALSERVKPLLPEGSDVPSSAAGFHDETQFIATANAAHENNMSFVDLKDRVTAGQSLGEAMHSMKPDMDRTTAETKAKASEERAKQIQAVANTHASAHADNSRLNADANTNANARVNAK